MEGMSDSSRPYGLNPTRLFCPWDFPCKNTGVDHHLLLHGIFLTQGSYLHLFHLLHLTAGLGTLPLVLPGKHKDIWDKVKFSCLYLYGFIFLFNLHIIQFTLFGIQIYEFGQAHRVMYIQPPQPQPQNFLILLHAVNTSNRC